MGLAAPDMSDCLATHCAIGAVVCSLRRGRTSLYSNTGLMVPVQRKTHMAREGLSRVQTENICPQHEHQLMLTANRVRQRSAGWQTCHTAALDKALLGRRHLFTIGLLHRAWGARCEAYLRCVRPAAWVLL